MFLYVFFETKLLILQHIYVCMYDVRILSLKVCNLDNTMLVSG